MKLRLPRVMVLLGLTAGLHLGSLSPAVAAQTQNGALQAGASKPAKPAPKPDPNSYARRSDVRAAAQAIAGSQSLDVAWVRRVLARARFVPAIARAVAPAPAGVVKNWAAYRERFVEPQRIGAGHLFWKAHQASLQRAEQRYGVPAAIVVGVIGVETLFGQHTGNYRVLDALATLAFDFPKAHPRAAERSAYFRGELAQFLRLCQTLKKDPQQLRGSYAGAMGLPQFMPSSWLNYAVDFDGDGRIDLFGSAEDAIGSVANYLASFGWQRDQPAYVNVALAANAQDKATLLAPDILPTFSKEQMLELGAHPEADGAPGYGGKWALIEVFNGADAPSYFAGTENFYVLTRYNWSSYYALAVIELGTAIQATMQATPGS